MRVVVVEKKTKVFIDRNAQIFGLEEYWIYPKCGTLDTRRTKGLKGLLHPE